jgi:hypothetical protein
MNTQKKSPITHNQNSGVTTIDIPDEKTLTVLEQVTALQPEFNTLPPDVLTSTVARHIRYIISELAVYQRHTQQNEEQYKKNNPLKIRVTIDKTDRGYHIQAWHNGTVLTGYVSPKSFTPNANFLKCVEKYSDALLAEIVYPKEETGTTKIWEQLKSGGTQGKHYRIDS